MNRPLTIALANVAFASGVLRFEWAGEECWDVYRGDTYVAEKCGAAEITLEAGTYTIKPDSQIISWRRLFRPFTVRVSNGMRTTVSKGGLLDANLQGLGCWEVRQDDRYITEGCNADEIGLEAGSYTLKADGGERFSPFRFTIRDGYVTTVGR